MFMVQKRGHKSEPESWNILLVMQYTIHCPCKSSPQKEKSENNEKRLLICGSNALAEL